MFPIFSVSIFGAFPHQALLRFCCAGDAAATEKAEEAAAEGKALKAINFPEMDADALPSSFVGKVLACCGKWQIKMQKLVQQLDPDDATTKGLLGAHAMFSGSIWSTAS